MMEMKDENGNKSNGVMQLNMGEGKTSVIVPMIVSTLGKQKEKVVCRVTVLNSIFETNSTLLRFAIGGLINKRTYTVPCRRDFPITSYTTSILNTYKECLEMGGVIITLPEYRLSFRLMMYNNLLKEDFGTGKTLYGIEDWLRKHARDIVDESDEIFSVKYQLIYTTGQQLKIDGDRLRWVVCRKLLQLLQEIAPKLFELYGTSKIEFSEDNRHHFSHFRVLGEEGDFKRKLNEMMADGILGGKIDLFGMILNEEDFAVVRKFLVDEDLTEEDHQMFMEMKGVNEERHQILLIVSGYLRRGILFTALKKRWRVEFGVNPKGPRLLAVPFRAKDVAAERTEYGHADMAIALTYLSYYYSGLSDEELMEVFKVLSIEDEPESTYSAWISLISGVAVADSVRSYKGVNLDDFEQKVKYLFPVLRRHKLVVDFWLENVAFPKECKQFPGKLVTNAWDLCFELNHQITTGFSGTNDTSLLLPAQISQRDLDELKKTNEEVEVTLLRPENEYRRSLKMGVKGREMLSYLKEDNLRVLIDSGALMLELGNEGVAKLWLEIDCSLEACVYFNEGNQLVVKTRSALHQQNRMKDELLTLSSFKNRMDNCAIYLDDQHTRGTDLKLPRDFRACVTIGSGLRRDKLIQSCMRMRKLGKGQSVHFYLSHDVDTKMREEFIDLTFENPGGITVEHVLNWTKMNSKKFEEDGLVYWANAGKSYGQKLMAEELHIQTGLNQWDQFGQNCHEPEVITLKELYGTYLQQHHLCDVVPAWFTKLEKKLAFPDQSKDFLWKGIESKIVDKIRQNIPAKIYTTSMLEEEQERELEVEEEKEVQVERPSKETALVPRLHPNLVSFLFGDKLYSENDVNRSGALNLCDVFMKTNFSARVAQKEWGMCWHATEDFTRSIQLSLNGVQNQFLRPVTYFISREVGGLTEILLISQFEANYLIPVFRQLNIDKKITLHMFSPRRIDGQDILCNLPRLQLPLNSIQLSEEKLSPILISSGNLYFASEAEQKAFAEFLGLVLRPWGKREKEAFQAGAISTTGFMDNEWRGKFGLCLKSKFVVDPVGLVRAIMPCRNERINDSCHVIKMLDQCAYVRM